MSDQEETLTDATALLVNVNTHLDEIEKVRDDILRLQADVGEKIEVLKRRGRTMLWLSMVFGFLAALNIYITEGAFC